VIARLGNVLYWAGCSFGMLFAIGGIAAALHESSGFSWLVLLFFLGLALLAWLAGRACRYVLAGR
jgi:hypothetical protein